MRRLLVECGVAETRCALMEGDEAMRFWFAPARGDEGLPRPPDTGDRFRGRVRTISKPLRAAFVDIGDRIDGFLPLGKAPGPTEGETISVEVRRPAIGAKGARLARLKDEAAVAGTEDAALWPFRFAAAGTFDEILVDRGEVTALLGERIRAGVRTEESLFRRCGAEAALEAAFERVVPLDGGARLAVDETEAMTTVDIDAGARADAGSPRLNDAVNAAAADRLFLELSRRGVGGKIVVDFLPPSNADARRELLDALRAAKRVLADARIGGLAADGMFSVTAPRTQLSLLERATEASAEGWVREGRRFTLDWSAKGAVRALDAALAEQRAARLRLVASESIASCLARNERWTMRLAARYGARFAIVGDALLKDRDFHVEADR